MAKPTTTQLSRVVAGQLTKSEKRSLASRAITQANKRTHEINKAFKQNQYFGK